MLVGGTGQRLHLGAGVDETLAWNLGKGLATDRGIGHLLIEEELEGLPELEGRGIQIAQGP